MTIAAGVLLWAVVSAVPPFRPVESKAERFTAEFPGKAKVEKQSGKDGSVTTTWTVVVDDGALVLMVMKDRNFDVLTPQLLQVGFDGFRESLSEEAKVTSSQTLTLGGIAGYEVTTSGKELDTVGRLYLGEGRSWTLMCQLAKGKTPADIGCDRLMSSFMLLDANGKPRAAAAPAPAPSALAAGQAGPPVMSVDAATMNLVAEGPTFLGQLELVTTVTRAPAGASFRVDAKCKLGKKKFKTFSQTLPLTAKRGATELAMTFTFPSKPESCELTYFVVVNGKPVIPENGPTSGALDVACWPVVGDLFPGPCDQP